MDLLSWHPNFSGPLSVINRRHPPANPHARAVTWRCANPTASFCVIATAIQFGGTVHDLAEAELCYAPQFGAAKDPVNLAGMLAQNVLNGDMALADWLEVDRTDALLLDVRERDEFAHGHIPKAINLPLSELRSRYLELPKDRDIWICCAVGQRAYFATRFLTQHGYRSWNLSGGYTTYKALKAAGLAA